MRNIGAIAWKEIQTYAGSPMAYVIGAMFLAVTGVFFGRAVSAPFAPASINGWLTFAPLIFVVWAPILTMRQFAEEQKLGTLELLLTSPVRDYEVVLGKYLASLLFLVGTVAFTLYYLLLLAWFGDPDIGPVFTGYLGLVLNGSVALAIGLLASSLTSNQIVAAVLGVGILALLVLTEIAAGVTSGITSQILTQFSTAGHFVALSRGIIDTNDLIYFVSLTVLILFVTVRVIESHRWR